MLEFAVFLMGALLVVEVRVLRALGAYAVLTAVITAYAALSGSLNWYALTIVVLTAAAKLVAAPLGIVYIVRGNPSAGRTRPVLSMPARVALVVIAAALSQVVAAMPAFAGIAQANLVVYTLLCGVLMLVNNRNLLAHVMGLLTIGTSLTLAGAIVAPGIPGSLELGAAFDALLATLLAIGLARALLQYDPALDIVTLRHLKG